MTPTLNSIHGLTATCKQSLYKKGALSTVIFDRLLTPALRTPAWYHNPKVHKPDTHLGIPPGRPIISGNGCVTEKISAFLDICLNPSVPHTPSYIKDSSHFIQLMDEYTRTTTHLSQHTLLVTLDRESYTPIFHSQKGSRRSKTPTEHIGIAY